MLEGMESSTFTRPERGAELELRIDALAYGGNGIARLEGYVVFVSGAIPGDRVRAVVTKRKRGYDEASTVELPSASPPSPTTRARRGRCCPTSASSRSSRSRWATR